MNEETVLIAVIASAADTSRTARFEISLLSCKEGEPDSAMIQNVNTT